jgi:hypothetical protein
MLQKKIIFTIIQSRNHKSVVSPECLRFDNPINCLPQVKTQISNFKAYV